MRRRSALLDALGIAPSLIAARGLLPFAEATRLEVVETGSDGREHLLVPEAAAAWRDLRAAALADGIELRIVSAFRSVDRQAKIVRRKLEAGQRVDDVLCVSAPPGYSEHHTGRAVDVGGPGAPVLEESFARTAAFAWLQEHAPRFGFVLSYPVGNRYGYAHEPWHWCWTPALVGTPESR